MNLFLTSTTIPELAYKKIQGLTKTLNPRVGIIDAAAEPYMQKDGRDPAWLVEQFGELEELGFDTVRYTCMQEDWVGALEKEVKDLDCLYLSGGNTFVLNYYLNKTLLEKVVRKFIEQENSVLIGSSAGAIVLTKNLGPYSSVDDPSKAIDRYNEGLNLVDFNVMVHWNSEKYMDKLLGVEKEYNSKDGSKLMYIEDGQAIYFNVDSEPKLFKS